MSQNKTEQAPNDGAGSTQTNKQSAAVKALKIILSEISTGYTDDKRAYAQLPDRQVVPLHSRELQGWLMNVFFQDYRQTLSSSALSEAIETAFSMITCDSDKKWEVWTRYGRAQDCLEVDYLANDKQRVRIEPNKVTLIPTADSLFKFVRSADTLPLVEPKGLDNLDEALQGLDRLRSYINLENQDLFPLLIISVAYSIYGLRGFPIIALVGAPGSGKSETARLLRQLVDPNTLPLGSIAASDRDAYIEAKSLRLLTYDNIQPITNKDISDRLARIATGGGVRPRSLYTDSETNTMFVCNPIITTSIEVPARRSDLVDRMLTFKLARVSEEDRLPTSTLESQFSEDSGYILGGLYALIAKTMSELTSITPETLALPRLADLGLFGIAAERCLGLQQGSFMQLYREAMRESSQGVVEEEPLLEAIIEYMGKQTQTTVSHTPQQWSRILSQFSGGQFAFFSPKSIGKKLRQLTEDLEHQGIRCTFGRGKQRYIQLTRIP